MEFFIPVYNWPDGKTEVSSTAYLTYQEAMKTFIMDCETDDDIVYVMEKVASKIFEVKTLKLKGDVNVRGI